MRFENQGTALWYGTPDAPALQGDVPAPANGRIIGTTLTFAVQPVGARNSVELRYRVNGGAPASRSASLARTDVRANTQYFVAALPEFHVGDAVDYIGVASWPGGQVPSVAQAASFPSSFRIVASTQKVADGSSPSDSQAGASAAAAPPATGATAGKGPYKVQGYLFFEHGLPATGVVLRLYNKAFGGTAGKLGEQATDVNGYYSIAYDIKAGVINLDIRTVDSHGKEIALCNTKHAAGRAETVNLVVPNTLRPVEPEYTRLGADIAKEIGGLAKLRGAREDEEQKDLTLLAASTGWDARLIALAASAGTIATESGLAAGPAYGLLRAGLPSNKDQLARVQISQVETALAAALHADIIRLDAPQQAALKPAFQKFALATLREARTPGAVSSYNELLAKSGLTAAQQASFAELFFSHGTDPAGLWEKAASLGIPKDKIEALKLQGCLFQLTLNNARLTEILQHEVGTLANLSKLIDADLHQPEAWKTRLQKLASNNEKELAALIPTSYGSDRIDERLEAYAADLARRIRMSYPTHVTARMLESGAFSVPGQQASDAAACSKLLKSAANLGYRMGQTPIETFFRKHAPALTSGMRAEEVQGAKQHLKHLHRLHQITPSDEALKALLETGLKSAHEVVRIPFNSFMARYERTFPAGEAELVYRRAEQVHSTTFGVSGIAQKAGSSTGGFAVSAPPEQRHASQQKLIEQFPSMESLFGSLDFCQCEECRSVLGPAAYFVDILRFIDRDKADWGQFLESWKSNHFGASYPFRDPAQMQEQQKQSHAPKRGKGAAKAQATPYEVLIDRRPDLPNLPLTCENTNTVMPYIDIVNEILEYFVAHDTLTPTSGHDTGKAKTEELLAEPQNILPLAYEKLSAARYPLSLPFDLWHESVRALLGHLDSSLTEVLDVFRPSDDLFTNATDGKRYGYADVFVESLGLAQADHTMLTEPSLAGGWFKPYGYDSEAEALKELVCAKTLARNLDVTYLELAAVLATGYVNPSLNEMGLVWALGIDVEELVGVEHGKAVAARDIAAFEEYVAHKAARFNVTTAQVHAWLNGARQRGAIGRVLRLAGPDDGSCDFGKTFVRTASGSPADAAALLRINVFVRLWRKLGWTVQELDGALQALLPTSTQPVTLLNIGGALKTGLLYLAHLKSLLHRLHLSKHGLRQLPVLWADLPTTGEHSLYAQLFLQPSILKADAVFDDPFGNYLSNADELLANHLTAIQAALSLTAKDIGYILADAGQDPTTAILSVANLSLLYRYGLLAKALKFSVADLIALKSLAALNPFTALKPDPISQLADDVPYSQTIRFVDIAEAVHTSGFDVEDLNYLLSHQFDPVGKYCDDPKAYLSFIKSLATGLRAIQAAQAVPADLGSLTNEVLQQKISLVLSANDAAMLMGLWGGTYKLQVSVAGVQPSAQLDPGAFAQFPELALQYDPVTQSQGLTYLGALTDAHASALQTANSSPLFAALIAKVLASQRALFDRALSPFLALSDFQQILAPSATRLATLAAKLFPYIQQQLCWQFVTQTLTSSLGADEKLVQAFVLHPDMLSDARQPGVPLAATFTQVAQNQLDVSGSSPTQPQSSATHLEGYFEVPVTGPYRFYAQADKAGAQASLMIDPLPDPVLAGAVSSDGGEVDGMVVLKAATLYLLRFDGTSLGGGAIELLVQGETLPKDSITKLSIYSKAALDGAARARTLLIKAFSIIGQFSLSEREARCLLVEPSATDMAGLSLSQLPADTSDVTPASAAALFQRFLNLATYVRLRGEIAGGGDDLIGIFERAQRQLPPSSGQTSPAPPDLLDDLAGRIAALGRRDKTTVRGAMSQLGFTVISAASGASSVLTVAPLRSALGLDKLWRVLRLAEKFGVGAGILAGWATSKPNSAVAQDVRNTIKARYDPDDWLNVAPPIFDKLRRLQRDALVAFIMHRNQFESRDQLFEYLLVDPGMEPIVQTSRLRLAISSVQTFIQRCLLNLEPAVQPAALNADQWLWMKRYRVWQAGREIFMHPENYMEMEFRDDKTDLFQELEGTLLQNDITADLVEDALFTYLSKLEKIAHLEVVTMCAEQNPDDPQGTIIHVIARTPVQPRSYFYRRYVDQMWTAWEAISTSFDGDHIAAVVWQDRLNVFWLSFIHQIKTDGSSSSDSSGGDDAHDEPKLADLKLSQMKQQSNPGLPPRVIQVQLNWAEYYQGKWSTPATSGGSDDSGDDGADSGSDGPPAGSVGNPVTVTVDAAFESSDVTLHASVDLSSDPHAARISVSFPQVEFLPRYRHPAEGKHRGKSYIKRPPPPMPEYRPKTFAFRIVSKHSPPTVEPGMPQDPPPFPAITPSTTHFIGARAFQVQYVESIQSVDGKVPTITLSRQDILQRPGASAARSHTLTVLGVPLQAQVPEIGTLISPFFFADSENSFFVEPTLTEITIDKWEHWAIPVPRADGHGAGREPRIAAAFPRYRPPKSLPKGVKPFDGSFDPGCRYHVHVDTDGITNTAAVLHFGGSTVGTAGATGPVKPRAAVKSTPKPQSPKAGRR